MAGAWPRNCMTRAAQGERGCIRTWKSGLRFGGGVGAEGEQAFGLPRKQDSLGHTAEDTQAFRTSLLPDVRAPQDVGARSLCADPRTDLRAVAVTR